jgi:hypothetical protein
MDQPEEPEMVDLHYVSLTDYLPSVCPCPGRPSYAELTAHLSKCLGIPADGIGAALTQADPESLAIYLAGDHAGAVQLRTALSLDPEMIDLALIIDALSMPPGYICAALFSALERMSHIVLEPEMILVARLRHVKRSLLAAWKHSLKYAAPAGYLTAEDARCIGIGELVYRAMIAQCGKTPIEALSVEEFLQLAPKLIEFWPVSEEGLECLSGLLWETEDFIEMHLDGEFVLMSSSACVGSCR